MEYQALKEELQGSNGLIKRIRGSYLGNTVQMSDIAFNDIQNEIENHLDNPDFCMKRLIEQEFHVYKTRENNFSHNFISLANDYINDNPDSYSNTRLVISEFLNNTNSTNNFNLDNLSDIGKIYRILSESNSQSRKSRAGKSLENHLKKLFILKGFQPEIDFEEQVQIEGCVVDFFLPNKEYYIDSPEHCYSISCQTTSNDRFRLSAEQRVDSTIGRNCTAIGCDGFGDALGPDSLTDGKLSEASQAGFRFVMIGDAMNDRLLNNNAVMSYSELFHELSIGRQHWN